MMSEKYIKKDLPIYEIKDYSIQITGSDVENAIEYLEKMLGLYDIQKNKLQEMS